MSNYVVTDTELTQSADAIRTKGGTSSAIEWTSGTGFKSAIEAIPTTDSFVGGCTFGGSYTLPSIVLDGNYVDYASADSPYRGLITKYIDYSSLNSWEFGCCFKDYTPHSSLAFCVFGSQETSYFYNPSLEVASGGTHIWSGCTTTSSQWTTELNCDLSETVSNAYTYQIRFGWDGSKLYLRVINKDTEEEIGYTETAATTNPQTLSSSSRKLVMCNNADEGTSRFYFLGKILLLGAYIKENGVITWGADEL